MWSYSVFLLTVLYTPQPLYNTIVGVQDNFHVSYPKSVIRRVKCIGYIAKGILNCYLESNSDPCYIQDCVIMNRVIKRFRYIIFTDFCMWCQLSESIQQQSAQPSTVWSCTVCLSVQYILYLQISVCNANSIESVQQQPAQPSTVWSCTVCL